MFAQMQGHKMQLKRLKVEDALSYLDEVKYKFENQPQVYYDFLDIMSKYKSQSIDPPALIQLVSNLFHGNPELIAGFNVFLPPGYKIEVQPNEQVQVSIPGSNNGPTIHPTRPPTAPGPHPPVNHNATQHSTTRTTKAPATVPNDQSSHSSSNAQQQDSYIQNSPSTTHSPPAATQSTAQQPVKFKDAINYVNKIKIRFEGQRDIYEQFSEILDTYKKGNRDPKDVPHEGAKPLTDGEVYAQVAKLFQNQEDLLQEFGQFLPDANGAANALVGLAPATVPNNQSSQSSSNAQQQDSYNQSLPTTTHSPPAATTPTQPPAQLCYTVHLTATI